MAVPPLIDQLGQCGGQAGLRRHQGLTDLRLDGRGQSGAGVDLPATPGRRASGCPGRRRTTCSCPTPARSVWRHRRVSLPSRWAYLRLSPRAAIAEDRELGFPWWRILVAAVSAASIAIGRCSSDRSGAAFPFLHGPMRRSGCWRRRAATRCEYFAVRVWRGCQLHLARAVSACGVVSGYGRAEALPASTPRRPAVPTGQSRSDKDGTWRPSPFPLRSSM
jgi:hypothetical protein